jgi:hypothetical protein
VVDLGMQEHHQVDLVVVVMVVMDQLVVAPLQQLLVFNIQAAVAAVLDLLLLVRVVEVELFLLGCNND